MEQPWTWKAVGVLISYPLNCTGVFYSCQVFCLSSNSLVGKRVIGGV